MAYEVQYRSQCGSERGYLSVLLFLGLVEIASALGIF